MIFLNLTAVPQSEGTRRNSKKILIRIYEMIMFYFTSGKSRSAPFDRLRERRAIKLNLTSGKGLETRRCAGIELFKKIKKQKAHQMTIAEHAERTEKTVGVSAEDIHKWIDGFFDSESFADFLRHGDTDNYDPYEHRKFRHCQEALEEAYREFSGKYSRKQIKAVFECHIRDDYQGYLPLREDFTNGTFTEKYHENNDRVRNDKILTQAELSEYFKGKNHTRPNAPKTRMTAFRLRIVLPTILAIILFIASIFIIILPVFRNNMLDRKKEMIKELTTAAASIIEQYVAKADSGFILKEAAQKKAASEIRAMRYGEEGKDYFWITDMHPKMIMHPYRPDLINQDLTNYKDREDKSGKKLFVEFVRLVEARNEGYLEYLWQWKDDHSRAAPKLSYVRGIAEWDWIIGTGIYINDVEEELDRLTENLLIVFTIISLGLIFILLSVVLQSSRIEDNRLQAESGLIEAKERYRALVEASNEGYILEVNGEIIYSNHVVQRLLGYAEDELAAMKIWELLDTSGELNGNGAEQLKKLFAGNSMTAEFEARVKSKRGEIIEVVISTSRIFFSQKNGHVFSFRRIRREPGHTLFSSPEGGLYHIENQFVTQKVGDVCRKVKADTVSRKLAATQLDEKATVLEALTLMVSNRVRTITIVNPDKKVTGIFGYPDLGRLILDSPSGILLEIKQSKSVGHVVQTLNRLPAQIRELTDQGSQPDILRATIGKIFDAAIVKFIEISFRESGNPPVDFAFLSLGSNARHEMTMFSDQDNALIFEDVAETELMKVKRYFLKLTDGVCTKLNQAGYPFCPGGIMASNPRWCLSVTEWKKLFAGWVVNGTPESILEVNVFFDIHCAYGEPRLVHALKSYMLDISAENPEFFIHFARNCLLYKAPLNVLGHIRAEIRDGVRAINIKHSLKPIELLGRLYALKNRVVEPGTIPRLIRLKEKKVITDQTFKDLVFIFDFLWQLRFKNQILTFGDLKRVNDDLDLDQLTEIERQNLRNVLSQITVYQTKISYEFLGMAQY